MEKEVSLRFVDIGKGKFKVTSVSSLDSIKLINKNKYDFTKTISNLTKK